MDTGWDQIVEELRPHMDQMHERREKALVLCRKAIQRSSKSIRHVHREEFEAAEKAFEQARDHAAEARRALADHPQLLHAGYLQDAEKEVVEAMAVLAMVRGEPYPRPSDLGVDVPTYLNGMGEAASEMRRYALDRMRAGDMPEAERLLQRMEAVYEELITFDYPDSLTKGLRRTCDALRAVVERTRSDLTMTQTQQALIDELRRAKND